MEDEHFIVWMRTAGLPNFRKLWGRLPYGLSKGSYKVMIKNEYNVEPFNGKKSFVLSTSSYFGGKNDFLAISFLLVGLFAVLYGVGSFFMMYKKANTN